MENIYMITIKCELCGSNNLKKIDMKPKTKWLEI